MTINELTELFGTGSEGEILEACKKIEPALRNYQEARMFLRKVIQRLIQIDKPRKAVELLKAAGMTQEFKEMLSRTTTEQSENVKRFRYVAAEFL